MQHAALRVSRQLWEFLYGEQGAAHKIHAWLL
jgi:hypothetical protein